MSNLIKKVNYLKEIAMKHEFECGWMRDETIQMICAIIRHFKPDLIIHTGFLWGKSSIFILDSIQDYSTNIEQNLNIRRDESFNRFVDEHSPSIKSGKLISIDPNLFLLPIDEIVEFLKSEYKNFSFYYMTSEHFFYFVYPSLNISPEFLLGVVDGDHTRDGCMLDLMNLNNIGSKVILVDDTIWLPYLNDVCMEFSSQYNYSYINFPLYSGLGILTKNV